jgi:hypothetical protein
MVVLCRLGWVHNRGFRSRFLVLVGLADNAHPVSSSSTEMRTRDESNLAALLLFSYAGLYSKSMDLIR